MELLHQKPEIETRRSAADADDAHILILRPGSLIPPITSILKVSPLK
jgi:hypothetical protein